jgi:hypothetical protein
MHHQTAELIQVRSGHKKKKLATTHYGAAALSLSHTRAERFCPLCILEVVEGGESGADLLPVLAVLVGRILCRHTGIHDVLVVIR